VQLLSFGKVKWVRKRVHDGGHLLSPGDAEFKIPVRGGR
jgi:hypothetical protein